MTLRYCESCKHSVSSEKSLLINGQYYCLICNKTLLYFGREEASLSLQDVLDEYDMLHPYKPLADYDGTYKTFLSPDVNASLLECDDVLAHDPNNKDALMYKSKYDWSNGVQDRSLEYAQQAADHHRLDIASLYHYVILLIANQCYQGMQDVLDDYESELDGFYFMHHKAIAFLGLKDLKQALVFFYKSYALCSHNDRKFKIKQVIRQLHSLEE